LLGVEMEEIEKAVGALDVTENIPDVGAARKQRVNGCDEITFIGKDALAGFGVGAHASGPRLDAGDIAAGVITSVVCAEEINHVATPPGREFGLLCRWAHGRARAWY
jgi:hypothetical protein